MTKTPHDHRPYGDGRLREGDVAPTSNLESVLSKLRNAEGESWVYVRESEAEALTAEIERLTRERDEAKAETLKWEGFYNNIDTDNGRLRAALTSVRDDYGDEYGMAGLKGLCDTALSAAPAQPDPYKATCEGGSGGPCTQPDCEKCWKADGTAQPEGAADRWFRVEVSDHAGQIVAIEPEMLAGRDIGVDEERKIRRAIEHLKSLCGSGAHETSERRLTLDNAGQVFFYEQDHYYLSNFSAFMIQCNGMMFPTSEHAYHWDKFPDDPLKQRSIQVASSAHDAFKLAERWRQYRRPDWDDVKIGIMRGILRLKAEQHEYVRRKLLQTGDRELIENSWRDDYWGWGPNRDGRNMLGKLWMEIRAELRSAGKAGERRE